MGNDTDWSPERKIVGGAIAVVIVAVGQAVFGELALGIEGALAIIAAYLLPNKRA